VIPELWGGAYPDRTHTSQNAVAGIFRSVRPLGRLPTLLYTAASGRIYPAVGLKTAASSILHFGAPKNLK
jgi:hypothetical protein